MADSWWVTWKDEADGNAARASALIWGPQSSAPPQISGMFEAGPFPTLKAAQAYEKAIGTNAIVPPPGTPIIGDVQPSSLNPLTGLSAIGDFFGRLGEPQTWLRLAEFAIGGTLIFIAVNHLLDGKPAAALGIATKTAAKAAVA
jgi:hypothetical protein